MEGCRFYPRLIGRIVLGPRRFVLYENGKGTVAYGKGTGETLKGADYEGNADEMHYQVLSDFTVLEEPLSAAEVRTILDRNVVFLRTMSGAPDGQKILDRISAR
jgi:hypothetical protein